MKLEFVIVTFPTSRAVRMDGLPFGRTGTKKRVEAGHHRFDLGPGNDYTPAVDQRDVIGTSFETPMLIPFAPIPSAIAADAVVADAAGRAARRKRSAAKRATSTTRKRAAAGRKKKAGRPKSSTRASKGGRAGRGKAPRRSKRRRPTK